MCVDKPWHRSVGRIRAGVPTQWKGVEIRFQCPARIDVHTTIGLNAAAAFGVHGVLVVLTNDGLRCSFAVYDKSPATGQCHESKVIARIDDRTDWPVTWPQHGVLAWRPAGCGTRR